MERLLQLPEVFDYFQLYQLQRLICITALKVSHAMKPFVELHSFFHVLEMIACGVKWNEPVLLVGEIGTGKTTLVQNLAARLGQKLTVLDRETLATSSKIETTSMMMVEVATRHQSQLIS
ncbi:midasin-like [Silene latifolia]|uniref:midasin-like n=1 Tax=Silene latifolia TaxID=37657 RepID=UPI003D7899A2